ncbi:hypothetical protein IPZ58_33655 [Streptomyces roseoverticillatus]|uniref:hypothetical protein n=1 Tax=Streptomyces roseoverticillatus TaxID=66429 RepID=UPI001F2262D8|nr:hypothetical protein [Streptomyces roseoverticillatus]MCF3106475.1 hypothetical protein [Streptomyces roseoverticillatus]
MKDDNVLFLNVPSPEKGHRALDALREAHSAGRLKLREGAVISRADDGTLDFPDAVDNSGTARAFAVGGLIGGLLGILGGPLGVMIGFGAGGLMGGVRDAREATAANAALEMLAAEVPPGSTVLAVEIVEDGPEEADAILEPYGEATRYRTDDIRHEVEAAIAEH